MQLLSVPDEKVAKAARRLLLLRVDELLVNQVAGRHDVLMLGIAAELEQQARQTRLPLGTTDDLVARLLQWPVADPAQRAAITAHCIKALQITSEKHQSDREARGQNGLRRSSRLAACRTVGLMPRTVSTGLLQRDDPFRH